MRTSIESGDIGSSQRDPHQDPSNWKWGIFYHNTNDPRVWVPKRNPVMGWTVNFAHRAAYWWLIGLTAIPLLASIIVMLIAEVSK